ncbi:MAG: glycosyltransferase family 4 protein [Candidatus Aenigmarchaeota archaeon]|nr:glycosyltransferase family 4 protein [Candidatus Aenigmarchaeota archaeon]
MNILYFIAFFRPHEIGGAEISSRIYAETIAGMGERVFILTPNFGCARFSLKREGKNLVVIRFPFPASIKVAFPVFNTVFFNLYLFFLTAIIVSGFRIDIIHIQSSPFFPAGIAAAKLFGKKSVITVRDIAYFSYSAKLEYFQRYGLLRYLFYTVYCCLYWPVYLLGRSLYRKADRIIPVSRYMEQEVITDLKMGREGIETVYNVIERDFVAGGRKIKTEKNSLLYVGRLAKSKGFDMILDSLDIVKRNVPGIKLYVVGNSDIERYKEIVGKKKLGKNVTFLGRMEYEQMKDIYRKFDIVVLPSVRAEPLSRVLIECSILGKAVVATDTGGTNEVIRDRQTGILVKPSAAALAGGIQDMIKGERMKKNCEQNIRKMAKFFEAESNAKRLKGIYRSLLE